MYLQLLNTIYELMQNRIVPTKERLIGLGYSEEYINYLLANNLIFETEPNIYKIASVKELFQFGKGNLLQGNKRTAQECFELCYRIKPRHRDTCLQLFYNAVSTQDYEDAYKYLYALENVSTNEHLRKDYKIYLFLLSQVSEVPELYKEKLAVIKENPFIILHRKPNELQKQDNIIIRLVLKGKYKFAIERLNNFLAEDYDYAVHRIIIKTLLSQIVIINDKYKSELLEKIKKKSYREILSMLEHISLIRELRSDELSILSLIQSIINIFETGEAPVPIENSAETIAEAIDYYDYQKALDLETEFMVTKHIPLDGSSIYLLLLEINKLIRNINRLNNNGISISSINPTLQG